MTQSGYDINDLVREAQTRWLKPAEVLFFLENYKEDQLTHRPPQKPASGSLFLFNKRVLRFFRKDGHDWRKKKDGRTVGEAHERLKVGNIEALNCYYAHGEQNPTFQRRSYWMLDPVYAHIVLVHYRDIRELSPGSASTFSQSLSSHSARHPGSAAVISELYEANRSPGAVEVSSDAVIKSNAMDQIDMIETKVESSSSPELEVSQALRRLEEQLSLDDDSLEEIENSNDWDAVINDQFRTAALPDGLNDLVLQRESGFVTPDSDRTLQLSASGKYPSNSGSPWALSASISHSQEVENLKVTNFLHTDSDYFTTLFDQGQIGMYLEADSSLTIAEKQKFSIREISPEWVYATEFTKVVIVGSFLCDPSESAWTCMFGDIEVPVQIIREGVICCQAPPLPPGKVTLCITSGNRESCSEVREFEYRVSPSGCAHCRSSQTETTKNLEETILLVRFVQMLLSDPSGQRGDVTESISDLLGNFKADEESWGHVVEALLVGSWTSSSTTEWLLQELLKDKLQHWLSSRSQGCDQPGCSLSKKEQGVIHMVAGLGFEWALTPILNSGVGVNFRNTNGWTALHWAARFGREKMVAALIASGASAGAVTDPNSQDPTGKTPASIAATNGHKGLAGYLSEVALTSHLSSLTLEENELSKGSADVEAQIAVNSISQGSLATNEDNLSLKDTLAAVRNATQAAARIQAAFRAHSFRRRQEREAAAAAAIVDENYILCNDFPVTSTSSKLVYRNARDYNTAALSIQKNYRGWKGRKGYLAIRQKVVKIQAHVRGHQVRKQYKIICWAVSVLEKVVLRWRRKGVGLRGFRREMVSIDESEDEDILKVFRKQNMDKAIDEAVSRVLSMVDSLEARQQYRRILERYRKAKAELPSTS